MRGRVAAGQVREERMAALHKKQKLEEEKMRTNDERYPRLLLRCCTLLTVLCSARVGVIVCSARNLAGAGGGGVAWGWGGRRICAAPSAVHALSMARSKALLLSWAERPDRLLTIRPLRGAFERAGGRHPHLPLRGGVTARL